MSIRLMKQRMCWRPTFTGWISILLLLAGAGWFAIQNLMPFLAPTQPVRGALLVVEGWAPDYALEQIPRILSEGGYKHLLVTGTEIERGSYILSQKSYAQLAANTLRRVGMPEEKLVVLPSARVERDRTYTTALEVRDWLRRTKSVEEVDVLSIGPHARRSWLLYKMALGQQWKVGVISFPRQEYDPNRWWKSSNGVRDVVDELVAYVYARVLFRP